MSNCGACDLGMPHSHQNATTDLSIPSFLRVTCDIECDPDCDAPCHAGHYITPRKPHLDGSCESS